MALRFVLGVLERGLGLRGIRRRTTTLPSGKVVSYLEGGRASEAPSLLLVHGLGSSNMNWVRVITRLARRHHVVAPDLPGFGKSPLPVASQHQTLRDHTDTVVELIASDVFQGPVAVAGQSLGGWIAVKAARASPAFVDQLVLINSAGFYYDGIEELRAALSPQTKPQVHALWKRMWHRPPAYYAPFWRAAAAHLRASNASRFMETLTREDFINEDLEHLGVPVSIIWGRSDRFIPAANVDELVRGLRSTRVHWIAQCGHVPPMEAPRAFTRALESILGVAPEARPVAPAKCPPVRA